MIGKAPVAATPLQPIIGSMFAAMIAVAAMACQYALLRLALPKVVSTAVMTGNLTNAVLSLMEIASRGRSLAPAEIQQLRGSLRLLLGFLIGCLVAAAAVSFAGDWAWVLPVGLSALAVALPLEGPVAKR